VLATMRFDLSSGHLSSLTEACLQVTAPITERDRRSNGDGSACFAGGTVR
jgi:hypothetical protein